MPEPSHEPLSEQASTATRLIAAAGLNSIRNAQNKCTTCLWLKGSMQAMALIHSSRFALKAAVRFRLLLSFAGIV
jgi:hypothetical protein